MKQNKQQLNIFDVLKQIDSHDEVFFDALPTTEQKQLHPLVLTRWMSGTSDPGVIQLLNLTNNRYNFALAQHKPLLMRMLLVSAPTSKRPRRYRWLAKTSGSRSDRLEHIVKTFYNCSPREAASYVKQHTFEEVLQMAEHIGMQSDEIKALKR